MRLYRDPAQVRQHHDDAADNAVVGARPLWVTLGTFDGLHVGHQYLIELLRQRAADAGNDAASMVITFELHPRVVLKHRPPRPILSLGHKLRLLAATGVDATLLLRFDQALARVEPEDFVRDWLVGQLRVAGVVLGYDSRFGHKARGDYELLAALGRELGFATVHGEPVALPDGEVVSSTAVREAVARHDLSRAAAMLGRPFSVLGRVIEGQQLGRQLGFPTANIRVDHDSLLPFGIYAVRAEGVWGAASVGVRPTVERDGGQSVQPLLEVHLLDWSGSLYGRRMEVEFHHYVRPEWKFDSLDDLRAQIEQDCRDVREWAKANGAR